MEHAMVTDIEQYLSKVQYPVSKQDMIKQAKDKGAPHDVMSMLNGLPNRDYMSMEDLSEELMK